MLTLKPFYYIRHGETDWNFESRCMGQQDIVLNATGIKQARDAQNLLAVSEIKTICYSPLIRAKETAIILNEKLNKPLVEIDNLKECGWGVLEGKLKGNGESFLPWASGETPEGAESYLDFLQRAIAGVNEALTYPTPLIVAHGGIYWAISKSLTQKHEVELQNCVPIYHKPPIGKNECWQITFLEELYDRDPYEIT